MPKGKQVTTHEELTNLVQNKSHVFINAGATGYHVPAVSLLYRQYKNVCKLLNEGYLFEYIPKVKSSPKWDKIYKQTTVDDSINALYQK